MCEEKTTKIKLQMNEHEISIHVNDSQLQIVQLEFTTQKYKVKLSAEAANGSVLYKKKLFLKISQINRKTTVLELFLVKLEAFRS